MTLSVRYQVGERVRHRILDDVGDVTGTSADGSLVYVNFGEPDRAYHAVPARDLVFPGFARFSPGGWILHDLHGNEITVVPGDETAASARAAVASQFHASAKVALGRWDAATKTFAWSAT